MSPGRKSADYAGKAARNWAIACKGAVAISTLWWKRNIDGLVQHEISHLFGCQDYTTGHPKDHGCIMFYNWWWNCIYEICWNAVCYIQTPFWCSDCQAYFDSNWDKFYQMCPLP